jgi:hypothetical protein
MQEMKKTSWREIIHAQKTSQAQYRPLNFQQKAPQVLTDSNIYGYFAVRRKLELFYLSAHISSSVKYLFVNYTRSKFSQPKINQTREKLFISFNYFKP